MAVMNGLPVPGEPGEQAEQPGDPDAPEERLRHLLSELREAKRARRGGGSLSLKMIADLTYDMRRRTIRPGEAPPTEDELRSGLSDATLSGVFNGKASNPDLVYDIARALGGGNIHLAREAKRLTGLIRAKAEQIRADEKTAPRKQPAAADAVIDSILVHLPGQTQPATGRTNREKLRLAVEIALGRAIIRYATKNGKASLAGPLLNPVGFLADPGPAGIIARAMTGDGTRDTRALGQAWADAFLGGTRTRDLTEDASEFIGYIRNECGLLAPLHDLSPAAGPDTTRGFADESTTARRTTLKALEQTASKVRAGASGRDPPRHRRDRRRGPGPAAAHPHAPVRPDQPHRRVHPRLHWPRVRLHRPARVHQAGQVRLLLRPRLSRGRQDRPAVQFRPRASGLRAALQRADRGREHPRRVPQEHLRAAHRRLRPAIRPA